MASRRNPMRWPADWRDAGALELLKDTPINCLLMEKPAAALAASARQMGLEVVEAAAPPTDVVLVKGAWPGVRRSRQQGAVDSGPTGAPWVDSNGWLVRLERTRAQDKEIWVASEPPAGGVRPSAYALAVADAAAYGGRWIVTPGAGLRPPGESWNQVMSLLRFFVKHEEWNAFEPVAAIAVVSAFTGPSQFLSREVLNLTGRLHQPYRIIEASKLAGAPLEGLQAIVYPDATAPSAVIRSRLTGFVEKGGLLVAGPAWGDATGDESHPRYRIRSVGRGRIAVARVALSDPYLVASDTGILLSHRSDPVRFWNAGAMGSFYTRGSNGRALIHVINYATAPGRYPVSMRVSGPYREARLWTAAADSPQAVESRRDRDGLEVHLPGIDIYGAIEVF